METGREPRILVVDDNPIELEQTLEAVRNPGFGYEIRIARGGHEALDYLLKPFGAERVHKALVRARDLLSGEGRRKLGQRYAGLVRATAAVRDEPCVLVRKRGRVIVLRPEEIDYVEAYGDYVRLRVGPETHLLRGTLTDMERRLAPAGFVRIHRSRLVNWQRVREYTLDREQDPVVVLKNGQRLDASPACLRELESKLGSGA